MTNFKLFVTGVSAMCQVISVSNISEGEERQNCLPPGAEWFLLFIFVFLDTNVLQTKETKMRFKSCYNGTFQLTTSACI